jgi:hypothetical protein
LVLSGSLFAAELSLSERINQAAVAFEEKQNREFKTVADSLDRWRTSKLKSAIKDLSALLDKSSPADKAYLAYHLLSVSPRHKSARDLFSSLGLPAPFDEKGQPVLGAVVPVCQNRVIVDQVSNLRYPPFSAVAEVVSPKSPAVQSYWKRQKADLDQLRDQLVGFAQQGEASNAYQVLAFYWPGAKEAVSYYSSQKKAVPRQRTWFTSVDRYLLDYGLAGIDCLDVRMFKPSIGAVPSVGEKGQGARFSGSVSWDFMENIRNCRIEGIFSTTGESAFSIKDVNGAGARLKVNGKSIELQAMGKGKLTSIAKVDIEQNMAELSFPVQLEVRGRSVSALVGGIRVCHGQLPSDYAYNRITIEPAGLVAQQMRVRYLGELEDNEELLVAAPPKAPEPPPAAPWLAERKKQLERPVTFRFEETSVEEVVSFLSQLSGMKIELDAKAETLKNMPITLDGKDLKLSSALDWLQRVSDLSWKPTENGVALTWSK